MSELSYRARVIYHTLESGCYQFYYTHPVEVGVSYLLSHAPDSLPQRVVVPAHLLPEALAEAVHDPRQPVYVYFKNEEVQFRPAEGGYDYALAGDRATEYLGARS